MFTDAIKSIGTDIDNVKDVVQNIEGAVGSVKDKLAGLEQDMMEAVKKQLSQMLLQILGICVLAGLIIIVILALVFYPLLRTHLKGSEDSSATGALTMKHPAER